MLFCGECFTKAIKSAKMQKLRGVVLGVGVLKGFVGFLREGCSA